MRFCSRCGTKCYEESIGQTEEDVLSASAPEQEPEQWKAPAATLTERQVETGKYYDQSNAYQSQYQTPQPQGINVTQHRSNGLAIGGFVVSLCTVLFLAIPIFGIVMALIGLGLSGAGLGVASKRQGAVGLAVAGLVLGIIFTVVSVVYMVQYWLPHLIR